MLGGQIYLPWAKFNSCGLRSMLSTGQSENTCRPLFQDLSLNWILLVFPLEPLGHLHRPLCAPAEAWALATSFRGLPLVLPLGTGSLRARSAWKFTFPEAPLGSPVTKATVSFLLRATDETTLSVVPRKTLPLLNFFFFPDSLTRFPGSACLWGRPSLLVGCSNALMT